MTDKNVRTRPTLALAMIVRDEEAVLARCLDSVSGVVDELVVVDTGSTDRTKEIAASYVGKIPGSKLLDLEWCDDFSTARNFALDHVNADWILHLDSDEELAARASELRRLLRHDHIDAFLANVVIAPGIKYMDQSIEKFRAPRLFQHKSSLRYKYPIHEQLTIDQETTVSDSDLTIVHFGPTLDGGNRHRSAERNLPLLLKAVERDPANAFFHSCLGNEYFFRNDWIQAEEEYREAEALIGDGEPSWLPSALRNIAWCRHKKGNMASALEALKPLKRRFPQYTDVWYTEGAILLESGDPGAAAEIFKRCLKMGAPPGSLPSMGGTGGWRASAALDYARRLMASGIS